MSHRRRANPISGMLALVLLFVGVKMVIADWYKVSIGVSLGAIASILTLSVLASVTWPKAPEIEHVDIESAPLESAGDQPSGSDADPPDDLH